MSENKNEKILNDKNLSQSVQPADGSYSDQADFSGVLSDNLDSNNKTISKKDRPQNKHLISLADRTLEERREIGRKGGLKSGETKRNRKTMRDTIIEMLAETITDDMIKEYGLEKVLRKQGTKTYMDAIMSACVLNAINGDSRSIQILRDTMGEMPTVKTENVTEIITKEDADLMDDIKRSLIG